MRIRTHAIVAAVATTMLLTGLSQTVQAAEILRTESGSPGASSHAAATVFGKIIARELKVSIQLNDGQTLTKSALKLGRGDIDMLPMPPVIFGFLQNGSRMYKKRLHKEAIAASKEIRSVFGYVASFFHPITYEDSGIVTWSDIKGKRVFTGPPSGAAAAITEQMIEVITGYKANKDYKAVRLDWGAGMQAMLDGQLDVFVRGAAIGAALVQQIGLKRNFRLLDVGAENVKSEKWASKFLSGDGRVTGIIPAGTYKGQVGSGDTYTGGVAQMLTIRKSLDEEFVYQMTMAIWTTLKEIHESSI